MILIIIREFWFLELRIHSWPGWLISRCITASSYCQGTRVSSQMAVPTDAGCQADSDPHRLSSYRSDSFSASEVLPVLRHRLKGKQKRTYLSGRPNRWGLATAGDAVSGKGTSRENGNRPLGGHPPPHTQDGRERVMDLEGFVCLPLG